jgi:hypothetical protein
MFMHKLDPTFSIEFTSRIAVFDPLDHDWLNQYLLNSRQILRRRLCDIINNVI